MGYVLGPAFLLFVMALSVYSLQLLVQCCSSYNYRPGRLVTYVAVAHLAFGTTGSKLAFMASVSASMGVCGSYLLFIAANLQSLFQTSAWSHGHWVFLVVLPPAILLSSIRDMKHFAFCLIPAFGWAPDS